MKEELRKILADKKAAYKNKMDVIKHAQAVATKVGDANKADDTLSDDVTFIANTYLWMDSHDDVHAKGVFSNAISDGHEIYHLHDHKFELAAKIGKIKSVQEKEVTWESLGIDKEGTTEILIVKSDTTKAVNKNMARLYKSGDITQHSVSMRYIKIALAINDEEEKEEKAVWDEVIDLIGNKKKAIEKGYFWYVKEASLREISAVIAGSNELTPTLSVKSEKTEEEIAALKSYVEEIKTTAAIKSMLANWK